MPTAQIKRGDLVAIQEKLSGALEIVNDLLNVTTSQPAPATPRGEEEFDGGDSSTIDNVKHDGDSTLTVTFLSGGVYEYDGVPYSVFQAFREADSKGRFFHSEIKDVYGYERVD